MNNPSLHRSRMLSRWGSCLILSVLAMLATQFASAQASGARMQSEELRITYIRPGVDLRSYTQFLLKPLNLEDTRITPPPWVDNPDPRRWQLSERNRKFLKTAYQQAMTAGLERSGEFNVVEKPFRGSLELEIKLISLTPYARSGEEVKTKGYGELTFEAALRDARSGELLAMFEGAQQVGEDYQENTEFNQGHNFAEHFRQWGRDVSERMTAVHQIE